MAGPFGLGGGRLYFSQELSPFNCKGTCRVCRDESEANKADRIAFVNLVPAFDVSRLTLFQFIFILADFQLISIFDLSHL